MSSKIFFFIFVIIICAILLLINWIFSSNNSYDEKNSTFECGFHSFLGQNRKQFNIKFFIFALLFLLFDLEILLVFPYTVSSYNNESFGFCIFVLFLSILVLGFVYEVGKGALKFDKNIKDNFHENDN